MLTRLRLAATLALLAALAAPALHAQDPGAPQAKVAGRGGPGGPGGGPGTPVGPGGGWGRGGGGPAPDSAERLLQVEAVQDELKVDDKTKAKLKSLGEDAAKERTRRREGVPKIAAAQAAEIVAREQAAVAEMLVANGIAASPKDFENANGGRGGPGGNAAMIERTMMNMAMNSLAAQVDAKMIKVLEAKQKVRLKQIMLQQEGARAFTDPNEEVVDNLGITDEQLGEIRGLERQMRESQWGAMPDFFNSFASANNIELNTNGRGGMPDLRNMDDAVRAKFDQAMRENQAKGSAEIMAAIARTLSKGQKSKYNDMIGEPFDLAKLRTPRGGPAAPAVADASPKAATKPANPPAQAAKPARKSLRDSRDDN